MFYLASFGISLICVVRIVRSNLVSILVGNVGGAPSSYVVRFGNALISVNSLLCRSAMEELEAFSPAMKFRRSDFASLDDYNLYLELRNSVCMWLVGHQ